AFLGLFSAGGIDEDSAHGLGGGGEEVPPAVPVSRESVPDQPNVRLVNKGCGLERLTGLLTRQPGRGEVAQVGVDQGKAVRRRPRIARLDRIQDLCDVGHAPSVPPKQYPATRKHMGLDSPVGAAKADSWIDRSAGESFGNELQEVAAFPRRLEVILVADLD